MNVGDLILIGGTGGSAQANEVISGETFTNDSGQGTGTMVNRGAIIYTPSTVDQNIVAGYHNGLGKVLATPSNIKSSQRGNSTLPSGNLSLDIAISSVDVTKSIILISVFGGSTQPQDLFIKAKLTSSVNLNIAKVSSTAATQFSWQVIEFNNVKSFQEGDFSIAPNSSTGIFVSSVNMSKSVLFETFTDSSYNTPQLYLSTSTYINVSNPANGASSIIHWQLIEFN